MTVGLAPRDVLDRRFSATPIDRHPLLAIWELTQACDLVCAHCRADATTHRSERELTTTEGKKLLTDLAEMGTPLVVLTGGDPAKRPDLPELIEHGVRVGLGMAVTPSGTKLTTREVLASLRDAGLSRLAVSVDGHDAATHDNFRGVNGSFTETMRILREARELGLPTQVNTSIHPGNLRGLAVMAKLVEDVGAVLWGVFVVVPTGRADTSLLLSPQTLEQVLNQLADIAATAPFGVKTTAAPHYRRVLMHRGEKSGIGILHDLDDNGLVRGPRGVTDGVGFLFVSHEGEVFPSGFLPVSAGDIRKTPIASIYRDSELFRRLRDVDQLGGKCGVCPFKRVCGGSRARAYAAYGDPMAEDPLCAYVPKGWNGRVRLHISETR